FFGPAEIGKAGQDGRDRQSLILDADEWPGRGQGGHYRRDDQVLHIELRRWADIFVIAPLDANTLAKLAVGLCDNCLTCVWRAWAVAKPIVLAPALHTLRWQHPFTRRHLRALAADFAAGQGPVPRDGAALIYQLN